MRKLIIAACVTTLWLPGAALAELAPQPKAKPKGELRRVLGASVEQVAWEEVAFSEVVEWLRQRGEINVVVRWRVLEPLGVTPDSTITLQLKNVSVAEVLSEALLQVSPDHALRYQGIGHTLTISSREDLNKTMYVKAYEVSDLLARIPRFADGPTVDLSGGGSASTAPLTPGTGAAGGQDDDQRSPRERITDLINVIVTTIEPDQWRATGGGEATIQSFNDTTLVVRAPLALHERLGGPLVLGELD